MKTTPVLKLVEQPAELDNETRILELQLKKHRAKIETHQRLMKEHQVLVKHHQAQLEKLQSRLNPPEEPVAAYYTNIFLGLLSQPPQERVAMRRWLLETPQKKTNSTLYSKDIPLHLSPEIIRWLDMIGPKKG